MYDDVMSPGAIKAYFDMLFGNLDQSELDKVSIVKRLNQGYHMPKILYLILRILQVNLI